MKLHLDTKEKGFYTIMIIGSLAGLAEGTLAYGFSLTHIFPGAVLTLVAAFVGGLLGFILKDVFRLVRGMKPYSGIHNDGMILGGAMGALTGMLIQLSGSADGANILHGAILGSFCGAMLGALPDEFVTPIMELMRQDTRKADYETEMEAR